ncbi:(2Fe-2S)-binding protein [Desulforhopalus singaporensis]|uniref:Purine hydroxylase delta subunit apoprotein n=1 Tax=Desulforhopalus singaporensis TaxID=91360 RepID=A0A1H0N7A8_9BACT|nr:(2Fe-2S)-binding protein [Desulforhopalus singaporensis]SDO88365.1 purine hydroxylase delta subunit apoprotein [Desulforhopalus singaporensis]
MDKESVRIEFTVNNKEVALDIPADATALHVLREMLSLTGTKEGCGIGECGACTIVVDGKAVNSCLMLGAQLDGRMVTTVEGLATESGLHPLQEKFMEGHAVQCGFCTPGLLMSSHALLEEKENPTRAEIEKAIAGNICRCTGYQQVITSIETAVSERLDGENR